MFLRKKTKQSIVLVVKDDSILEYVKSELADSKKMHKLFKWLARPIVDDAIESLKYIASDSDVNMFVFFDIHDTDSFDKANQLLFEMNHQQRSHVHLVAVNLSSTVTKEYIDIGAGCATHLGLKSFIDYTAQPNKTLLTMMKSAIDSGHPLIADAKESRVASFEAELVKFKQIKQYVDLIQPFSKREYVEKIDKLIRDISAFIDTQAMTATQKRKLIDLRKVCVTDGIANLRIEISPASF